MPSRSAQLPRAASLIVSSLGFIHDLRTEILHPDTLRGTSLDMDQYKRLFGTARIPTGHGCKMETASDSKHVVVLRRGQFCTAFCSCLRAITADDLARTFRLVRCYG
jgi:carnitine O-acetyltransferase